ncbi:MAG: VTT domain-containing protein [Myxococcota bacterium]|nr:VTT domain-containing protein [Myxococcota bacterium]
MLSIAIVGALLAMSWLLVSKYFTLTDIQQMAQQAGRSADVHPAPYVALLAVAQAVGMAFSLPTKALLTVLAGALLGNVLGAVATAVGVLTGTSVLFFATRRLLRHRVAKHTVGRVSKIEKRISERPIRTMIGMRLFIALPFGPCTVTAALSSMRFRDFLVGTFLGDIPVVVLYAIAGKKIFDLTTTSEILSWPTALALLAVGIVFIAGVGFGRQKDAQVEG